MRCSCAIRPHRADSRFCQRVLVPLGAISLLGIALTDTPLSAQEGASELTGCYDIAVGDWIVEEPVPGQPPRPLPHETGDSALFEIPPRVEFAGTFRDFLGGLTSRTRIVVPEGALPSIHRYMSGALVGDRLAINFSTGFAGVAGSLIPSGNVWAGTVVTLTDTYGWMNRRPVEMTRVNCDSPPPVSIDPPLFMNSRVEGNLGG